MILFLKIAEPYGDFSNFARTPVEYDDKIWPTTEHLYQAQKFLDPDLQEKVRLCEGPKAAADMGRRTDLPLRSDWEEIKVDIMRKALMAKIEQYPGIKDLLLSTGTEEIREHTSKDNYWADAGDGTGLNMLGKIWMELRAELSGNFYGQPCEQCGKKITSQENRICYECWKGA